jgi:transcriptional regulator with XRE-family HTH domain
VSVRRLSKSNSLFPQENPKAGARLLGANMAKFGDGLRALREKTPISLNQLARKMGWSAVYQSDVERGRAYPPNINRLKDFARHLGVDALELIELVTVEKKSIRLEINPERKIQLHTATILVSQWDTLTDEQLKEIERIVNESTPSQ